MIFSPQIESIWKWSLQLSRKQPELIVLQAWYFSTALFHYARSSEKKQNKNINLDLRLLPPVSVFLLRSSGCFLKQKWSDMLQIQGQFFLFLFFLFFFILVLKGRSEKSFTAGLFSVSWTFFLILSFSARRFCEWEIWSPQNVCESSLLSFVIRMLQCQLWLHTS